MNNIKHKQNFTTGYNQMPDHSQTMPLLPTGDPTGPRYAPYPVNPEILQRPEVYTEAPPGGIYPQTIPGYQCPPPAFIPNRMIARPMIPTAPVTPIPETQFTGEEQPAQTTSSPMYTPGFLRTQIGKTVRVEFLIGTSGLVDRFGTLVGVGTSYILIQEAQSDDILLCDIYSIKFVRFYY